MHLLVANSLCTTMLPSRAKEGYTGVEVSQGIQGKQKEEEEDSRLPENKYLRHQ